MAYDWKTELLGVFSRHADNCPVRDGGECTCGPLGYRASVRDWDTNRRTVSPTFENVHEAVAWQRDQMLNQEASRGLATERGELGALIDEFLQAAEDGMVRDGGNRPYTRDGVRALRGALSYVDSELGTMDVQDVRRRHIQALLDQLRASGVPPARIVAVAGALDSLYAYAIGRELVGFSPVVALQLPESTNGAAYAVPPPAHANVATEDAVSHGSTPGGPWTPPPPPAPGNAWTPPSFPRQEASSAAEPSADTGYPNGGYPTGGYPTPPPTPYPPPSDSYPPPTGPYPMPGDAYPPPPPYQTPTGQYPPPGTPYGTPPGAYPTPPPYPPPYGGYVTPYPTQSPPSGYGSVTSAIFGAPGTSTDANYDATMQERWLWWTVRIVVIVFVLIALVLVAESV